MVCSCLLLPLLWGKGERMKPEVPCEHDYFEDTIGWNALDGKLYQILTCRKCGHKSSGWTDPDTNTYSSTLHLEGQGGGN